MSPLLAFELAISQFVRLSAPGLVRAFTGTDTDPEHALPGQARHSVRVLSCRNASPPALAAALPRPLLPSPAPLLRVESDFLSP